MKLQCNVVPKLLQKVLEGLIDEMRPSVTLPSVVFQIEGRCPRGTSYGRAWPQRLCILHHFHPFGHIVDSHQDILMIMGF